MPGVKKQLLVVADTDALIASLSAADGNHQKATATLENLLRHDAQLVFPLSTITETVTTLTRKLNNPDLAEQVVTQITNGNLAVENADTEMLHDALKVFDLKGSKKNTLFDALVVATAQKLRTNIIFSYDKWYEKLGFTLAADIG